MTELEKLIHEAVQNALAEAISLRVETETSAVVKRLLDAHEIEYSALMHKAIMTALENLNKNQ